MVKPGLKLFSISEHKNYSASPGIIYVVQWVPLSPHQNQHIIGKCLNPYTILTAGILYTLILAIA